MTQAEADVLVKQARSIAECCDSCHDDYECGIAPEDECYDYLENGVIVRACCCSVMEWVDENSK